MHRSGWYYQSIKDDSGVIEKLRDLSQLHPTRGFDYYYGRIRLEGLKWNRKRVLRIYRMLNLKMRRKVKRRLPARIKEPLEVPIIKNHTWSMDFMSDSFISGRKFRVLNVIDDYNRESLLNLARFSYPAERVIECLEQIMEEKGVPKFIRVDNGPEFIAKVFQEYCDSLSIKIKYIQPGKPTQNSFVERFNRTFREDILDAHLFQNINQVNELADQWQNNYNWNHPHTSLNGMSPIGYAEFFQGASPLEKGEKNVDFYKLELSQNG